MYTIFSTVTAFRPQNTAFIPQDTAFFDLEPPTRDGEKMERIQGLQRIACEAKS